MIVGKRITLRAWEKGDLDAFTRWFNDPEVTINLGNAYPSISVEQEEHYVAKVVEEPYKYAIVLNEGNKLIGNCDLHALDRANRCAEVGIVIGEKDYWNQGFGREALGMLLEIGFSGLGLNRIALALADFNQRGYRCYQAAGFREEGRLRQRHFIKGAFCDEVIMAVLAQDYWTGRKPTGGNPA